MNNYSIEFNGNMIELPKYTIALAKKVEKLESGVAGDIEVKLKALYTFIQDILGKEQTERIIGKFTEADPSDINIVYLKIVAEFNRPVEEYQEEISFGILDDPRLEGAIGKLDQMLKIKGMNND